MVYLEKMTEHKPYVSASTKLPELNFVSLSMGIILGIIFGASSLYLALKVGLTVSASIPVAVLSVTLFRAFSKAFKVRKASILENNIVQTAGSAGESIAFGVAVTIPALLIMGYEMTTWRTTLVAVLGSVLGVLLMIPLRRVLIVKEHGNLTYPEGTACAEVLISGETGGATAKTVFMGFFVGLAYKFLNIATKLWVDVPEKVFTKFKGANISGDVSPELLGVGYIIGPRIASMMVAGGVLASLVLAPMIVLFGEGQTEPLFPATKLISEMSPHDIWQNYILYIGAGCVAAAGILSMVQSFPTIVRAIRRGLKSVDGSKYGNNVTRTDRDLSMRVVFGGILILLVAIVSAPALEMSFLGAILIIAFGFLFVTVSSRLVGEIGSSSNPISGMTVATLLLTCVIFFALGRISLHDRVVALSVAAIVCVAAAVAGATSQDLKTGFLVGATPRSQQLAIIVGALCSAVIIGSILNLLNDASTVYTSKNIPTVRISNVLNLLEHEKVRGIESSKDSKEYRVLRVTELHENGELAGLVPGKYLVREDGSIAYRVDPGINGTLRERDDGRPVQKYEAPKARLMSLIIDGILTQKLPWSLVLLGAFIAVVVELCGASALAFSVGVYLPISVSTPIFVGGMIRWLGQRISKNGEDSESSPGVLLSSGLIAGGAIAGIGIALFSLSETLPAKLDLSQFFPLSTSPIFSIFMFAILSVFTLLVGTGKLLK